METGQKIRQLRTDAGLTQEQLAQKLYVSRESVSKWETGQRRPDVRSLRELALLFRVDPDELVDTTVFSNELAECLPHGAQIGVQYLKELLPPFIDTLSERDRNVFIRRYYRLEDVAEISVKTGIGKKHVRTILMRTRRKLKKRLSGEL